MTTRVIHQSYPFTSAVAGPPYQIDALLNASSGFKILSGGYRILDSTGNVNVPSGFEVCADHVWEDASHNPTGYYVLLTTPSGTWSTVTIHIYAVETDQL